MDKLPIISAKPDTVKSSTQANAQSAANASESFGAVLAKQVAKEDTPENTRQQTNTEEVASEKIDVDDDAMELVESLNEADVDTKADTGFIDAQMLAMQATQASIDEATDGEVALDADALPVFSGATVVPAIATQAATNQLDTVAMADDTNSLDQLSNAKADVAGVSDNTKQKVLLSAEKQAVHAEQVTAASYQAKQEAAMKATAQQSQVEAASAINQNAAQLSSIQQSQRFVSVAPLPGSSNMIQAYPGKTGWNEAISQKIVWMVGATEQSATLTLNPKDLGPLQVVIQVNNEKADATFISENPEVRKALEDGMTQLRQSMSQSGVELGQTNVNSNKQHEAFQQANHGRLMQQNQSADDVDAKGLSNMPQRQDSIRVSNGLVDTFA